MLWRLLKICMAIALALPFSATTAGERQAEVPAGDNDRPIYLYANEFLLPGLKMSSADRTISAVEKAVAPRKLVVFEVPLGELEEAISQKKADMAIVGSAIYWRNLQYGMRDIATLVTPLQPDPDHAVGALVVTRANETGINGMADLKGKRLGINLPNGFQCYLTVLRDLADLGYDYKHFFADVTAYGLLPDVRLDALRRGEVDAVTLNTCYVERKRQQGEDVLKGLKPVGVQQQKQVACMTSTKLYPNWSFLISPNLDAPTIVKIASALHSMPEAEDGHHWTIASSFTSADIPYRTLKVGPYAYLNRWTIARVWREYKLLICLIVVFFLFGAWHTWRTHQLIKLRTSQLQKTFEEKERLSAQAKSVSEKYAALKHAFAVNQLSSLVAHELSQPLASMLLYAQGIRVMLKDSKTVAGDLAKIREGIDKIAERAGRAQQIVRAVRSYAKSDEGTFSELDLSRILKQVVERTALARGVSRNCFELHLPEQPVCIRGSELELELAFANIIQNGLDAAVGAGVPHIRVVLSCCDQHECRIVFSDNGPIVEEAMLQRLREPIRSLKPYGLGLGLSIVRAIVDKHLGKVVFTRSSLGGVEVQVILPLE